MPIGPWETFDDCTAANKDKQDPSAYCASIERRLRESKKSLEELRTFRAWISVEEADTQGDYITIDAITDAMPKYLSRGAPLISMHSNKPVGTMLDWGTGTTEDGKLGVWGDFLVYDDYPIDDLVWSEIGKAMKGDKGLTGLSIGAYKHKDKTNVEEVCEGKQCFTVRKIEGIDLMEVSSVDHPANKSATLLEVNAMAKMELQKDPDGRPPKEWWDNCVARAESFATDPDKFCGALWHHKPAAFAGQQPGKLRESFGKNDITTLIEKCDACSRVVDSLQKGGIPEPVALDILKSYINDIASSPWEEKQEEKYMPEEEKEPKKEDEEKKQEAPPAPAEEGMEEDDLAARVAALEKLMAELVAKLEQVGMPKEAVGDGPPEEKTKPEKEPMIEVKRHEELLQKVEALESELKKANEQLELAKKTPTTKRKAAPVVPGQEKDKNIFKEDGSFNWGATPFRR